MLRINISKDIEHFANSNFGGLTLGQVGVFAIALSVCVPLFLLAHYIFHFPVIMCCYISLPLGGVIGFIGLSKKDGMTVWQRRKLLKDYYRNRGKALYYVSTETEEAYREAAKRVCERGDARKKTGNRKQVKTKKS